MTTKKVFFVVFCAKIGAKTPPAEQPNDGDSPRPIDGLFRK
jgi:hypothetical protein